jgi:hypothetical protein
MPPIVVSDDADQAWFLEATPKGRAAALGATDEPAIQEEAHLTGLD